MMSKNRHWWNTCSFKIYVSHSLSAWGDRMWGFAAGIYLYYLYPESLLVTAIYGFAQCISVIAFGALIGIWIDKTKRLKAAQISLLVQNLAVVLCASLFIIQIEFEQQIKPIWNGILEILNISAIILVGVIANLGSVAMKIAMEKDWIVVLAEGNQQKLAKMNSVMRTIDLTTSILSPIIVGQILYFSGNVYSAIFIGAWNIGSVIIEYYILIELYDQIPQLGTKDVRTTTSSQLPDSSSRTNSVQHVAECEKSETSVPVPEQLSTSKTLVTEESSLNEQRKLSTTTNYNSIDMASEKLAYSKSTGFVSTLMEKVGNTWDAWKAYSRHEVRNAGIALSLLYMTVLGFDNITRGFALSQGVTEFWLGIFTAIGAIFGILGSLSFPYLRRSFGYLTTGNIGFGSETLTLLFCIASIFTYGSPFEYYEDVAIAISRDDGEFKKMENMRNSTMPDKDDYSLVDLWNNNISVLLLLIGIMTARFGLWLADLSVSQILQEQIAEKQRGVINGVQNSLNVTMDLIKFVLVIILPNPYTFGYLIAVSWLAILLGWIFFMIFSCQNPSQTLPKAAFESLTISTISSKVKGKSETQTEEHEGY